MLERTGRLTILYIEFVRYSKLEEIYGWQKLDEVLQTTANAVREFYDQQRGDEENLLMVSHGDDDFIFFTDLGVEPGPAEMRINEIAQALETLHPRPHRDRARRRHRGALRHLHRAPPPSSAIPRSAPSG
jgi:GGDEF domain-containing protein